MILKKLFLSIICITYCFTIVLAQSKPQQDNGEAIRINTELIQLDVVVTDKNGHVVDNLKQADFELLEDGKAQDISFFSLIRPQIRKDLPKANFSVASDNKTSIDVPLIEQSGRTFVILVDDLHISPFSITEVKKQLLNLVNNQLQENDRVAVVTTSGGLGFLQQLTDDPKLIKKAIEKLKSQLRSGVSPGDPAKLTEYQAQQIVKNNFEALNVALMRYQEDSPTELTARLVREIQLNAQQIVDKLIIQTTATLETIRKSILAMKAIPGRKTMILVTDGFLLERESNHPAQLRSIVDAATRAGVVVYSLGSGGLQVSSNYSSEDGSFDDIGFGDQLSSEGQKASLEAMKSIAQDTGGFSIVNNNNILAGLQNIVTESSSYYLLAYYPENVQADGKFKEIKVNLKGDKRLIVKTRKGYVAGGERLDLATLTKAENTKSTKNTEKRITENINSELLNAVKSIVPIKDIKLKIKADFLGNLGDVEKNNTIISLAVDLKDIDFKKTDNRYQNEIKAILIIIGEDGKVVHSTENNVVIDITDDKYKQAGQSWFFFGKTLSLKPGFYNIRFLVKDPITNKLGDCTTYVEVPNLEKTKLQLSNILLLHQENSENPENITFKGQAVSVFTEKSSIGFLCYIFSKENFKDSPQLTAQVQILQGNKTLFTSPQIDVAQKVDKTGRIVYGGQVPLTGFTKGKYQLKITVSEAKSKTQTSQEQDFIIEK